ncbi:hypothetical protein [Novosphingobium sp. M1R2S20]|uniref:Uncharacterized protein n=1 Tax=Novosphingobium rhizovicinum TaxID=3228928 RepID=A0ABV3R8M5_9SPHN
MKANTYVGIRYYAFNAERVKDAALDAYKLSMLLVEAIRPVAR